MWRGKRDVEREDVGLMWLLAGRSLTKEGGKLLERSWEKARKLILHQSHQRKQICQHFDFSLVETIFHLDLQNCKITHLCCFMSLILW